MDKLKNNSLQFVCYFLLTVGATLYLLQAFTPFRLTSDSIYYLTMADAAATGHGFVGHNQPIGYPLFVFLLIKARIFSSATMVIANCLFFGIGLVLSFRTLLTLGYSRVLSLGACLVTLFSFTAVKHVLRAIRECLLDDYLEDSLEVDRITGAGSLRGRSSLHGSRTRISSGCDSLAVCKKVSCWAYSRCLCFASNLCSRTMGGTTVFLRQSGVAPSVWDLAFCLEISGLARARLRGICVQCAAYKAPQFAHTSLADRRLHHVSIFLWGSHHLAAFTVVIFLSRCVLPACASMALHGSSLLVASLAVLGRSLSHRRALVRGEDETAPGHVQGARSGVCRPILLSGFRRARIQ